MLALVQFLVSVYIGKYWNCASVSVCSFEFGALDTCIVEYEVQGVVLCVE